MKKLSKTFRAKNLVYFRFAKKVCEIAERFELGAQKATVQVDNELIKFLLIIW